MKDSKLYNLDVFSSIHEPYWIASTKKEDYPALEEDIDVDVAIVGGGIVGITTAFLLKEKGLKVAIIEANKITHGTSGYTTAKITSQHGLIYKKIISKFGEEKARQYADANESSIDFIADLARKKGIDCDFCYKSAYIYTQSEDYIEKIEDEVKAACSLGIQASYEKTIELPFDVKAAIKFDNQAQFHPLKYLLSIAKDIPGNGSYIFEATKVVDIEDGENCTVITGNGRKVTASKVVIASHFPCYDGMGMYFARMYAEKSYLLGVKIKDKFPEGMFINAEDPGRSLRSQKHEDGEIVLVGGEHHKTGSEEHTNIHYENLCEFAKTTFNLQDVLYRWSTQDYSTVDEVPYVGYLTSKTDNILVATGFKKWGMTNGTAAARILTDLIITGESCWAPVYNPSRFDIIASGAKLASVNLEVAGALIVGKITPAPSDVDIKNGGAKVINIDGEKVGAYRDEQGQLHIVDITCTHLGCELVWNEAEKTWDCPCHGSRFSYDGDNVEGPAFKPLKHLGEGKNKLDANIF
ncbi:FAD-dependent oxidoreductase [Clostridium sp. CS001]|uniref:FAD-dependent oxidoreductase n=1 Tax=Clostridium sp. CS001 TaxID=2880648 RepID=UPI001CF503EE|nr:FAD-dependent oxidoreductase [Clostridium sp. CS001]MCB2290758.1 FAD-dependent oxidoreductase [Clostridium sp. CS001]